MRKRHEAQARSTPRSKGARSYSLLEGKAPHQATQRHGVVGMFAELEAIAGNLVASCPDARIELEMVDRCVVLNLVSEASRAGFDFA